MNAQISSGTCQREELLLGLTMITECVFIRMMIIRKKLSDGPPGDRNYRYPFTKMGSNITYEEHQPPPICCHICDSIISGALDVDDDIQNAVQVAIVLIT